MKKLIIVLVVFLAGCGMELKPTEERAFRDEIEKLKLVKDHKVLQLEIMRINTQIAQMQQPPAKTQMQQPKE